MDHYREQYCINDKEAAVLDNRWVPSTLHVPNLIAGRIQGGGGGRVGWKKGKKRGARERKKNT